MALGPPVPPSWVSDASRSPRNTSNPWMEGRERGAFVYKKVPMNGAGEAGFDVWYAFSAILSLVLCLQHRFLRAKTASEAYTRHQSLNCRTFSMFKSFE